MRYYLLLMFCIMTTLGGYSQSAFLLTEDNNYRPSDVVPKMNISLAGIDLACSKLTINTENLVSSKRKFVQTLLDSKDSISDITSIERKKRKYFSLNDDGMYLTGEEDALHKCSFRLPERWLPIHFSANDSIYGLFSGSGIYCKKLHYHKWGEYKTKVMGLDDIVLLTGDTLKNVMRLRTTRRYILQNIGESNNLANDSNILSKEIILANLDTVSKVITEEEYKWYAQGIRYPIMEAFMLKNSNRADGNHLLKADNMASATSYSLHDFFSDNADEELEYAYDENGNITMDLNKNIASITYNEIGKPRCIEMTDGGKVEYTYSASGDKLQVKHTLGLNNEVITTDYCGNMILENGKQEATLFDGGYMSYKYDTPSPLYFYYIKDYQGNNRVVCNKYKDNYHIDIMDYYPFGSISLTSNSYDSQRYFYNGKELDPLQGLFWYDYGARLYDGIRFTTMDPLATDYPSISPYAYCNNNPIRFIDKDGKRPSAYEAALMAQFVYNDFRCDEERQNLLDDLSKLGWTLSSFKTKIRKNDNGTFGSGLQSELFERNNNGKIEYAYIYAGTNSVVDAGEDVGQLLGLSPQYSLAIKNARILSGELNNKELTYVGHSLGGGEAAAASMATNRAAMTFNPASVSMLTKLFNGLKDSRKITNYRTVGINIGGLNIGGDPVNNLQDNLFMHAPGTTLVIPIGVRNPFSSHSIKTIVEYLAKHRK